MLTPLPHHHPVPSKIFHSSAQQHVGLPVGPGQIHPSHPHLVSLVNYKIGEDIIWLVASAPVNIFVIRGHLPKEGWEKTSQQPVIVFLWNALYFVRPSPNLTLYSPSEAVSDCQLDDKGNALLRILGKPNWMPDPAYPYWPLDSFLDLTLRCLMRLFRFFEGTYIYIFYIIYYMRILSEKFHGLTCKGCRLYVVLVLEGHIFSRAVFWYVFCLQATFDQGQSSRYPFWRNWSKLGNVKGNGWQHACYMLSKNVMWMIQVHKYDTAKICQPYFYVSHLHPSCPGWQGCWMAFLWMLARAGWLCSRFLDLRSIAQDMKGNSMQQPTLW